MIKGGNYDIINLTKTNNLTHSIKSIKICFMQSTWQHMGFYLQHSMNRKFRYAFKVWDVMVDIIFEIWNLVEDLGFKNRKRHNIQNLQCFCMQVEQLTALILSIVMFEDLPRLVHMRNLNMPIFLAAKTLQVFRMHRWSVSLGSISYSCRPGTAMRLLQNSLSTKALLFAK